MILHTHDDFYDKIDIVKRMIECFIKKHIEILPDKKIEVTKWMSANYKTNTPLSLSFTLGEYKKDYYSECKSYGDTIFDSINITNAAASGYNVKILCWESTTTMEPLARYAVFDF
jgi:hypothetical protein